MAEKERPVSEEERQQLLAKYEELLGRTHKLQGDLKAHAPGRRWDLIAAVLGASVLGAWLFHMWQGGVLWTIIGAVMGFAVTFLVLAMLTPLHGSQVPGTRSWEASLTLDPLMSCQINRRIERARTTDQNLAALLDREIDFLEKQKQELIIIATSGDRSPGKGYIGFTPYQE
jgi:NADPH:quinone reductase-like Zn-dependent oxidoreductase